MTLYLCAVDSQCESVGLSHIMCEPHTTPPKVLCSGSVGSLNWTGNPYPKTRVCPRCKKTYDASSTRNGEPKQ